MKFRNGRSAASMQLSAGKDFQAPSGAASSAHGQYLLMKLWKMSSLLAFPLLFKIIQN
jgi:hypothetical protein